MKANKILLSSILLLVPTFYRGYAEEDRTLPTRVDVSTLTVREEPHLCLLDDSSPIVVLEDDFKETEQSDLLTKEELAIKLEEERIAKEKAEEEARKKAEEERRARQHADSTFDYSIDNLEFHGVINWNNKKFTYYSQRVLPGGGLAIPGRHTADGFVKDEDGYIVLASNANIPKGTIVSTPFGASGKVYDRCPECSPSWFDVYTR